ncbi:MAG: cyclic lactone autoinducer peptide [Lachnospiraceae bacterium]
MRYNKTSSHKVAKTVANMLDSVLRTEANSTSCCVIYQPKAPKELERFKRKK